MGRDVNKLHLMAIKLKDTYPTRTTVNANNPNGTFKNSDPPGSLNGTPGDFAWAQDMWSFLEILMSAGSVTHSSSPDDAVASQRYDALVKIARDVWPIWDATHEYSAGVITVGSDDSPYYSLQASNTNHDPVSNPAWWRDFSFETLRTAARTLWPIWDAAETYPQGVGTVGSDGEPYFSLQASNLNHDPISSPIWWKKALIFDATKSSKGILFLGDQRIILANNVTDPNNDINFSVGRFTFDDGSGQAISPAYTKLLDATFIAGNGQGALDTGAKASGTWYHCFAIFNPTNGLSDYLFSTSVAAPTLPAGYTKKRRIGAIRTDVSSNIIPFFQYGKWFQYIDRIEDIDITTPGNTGTLAVITTPLGIPTRGKLNIGFTANAERYLLVTSPDETNVAVDANSPFTLSSNDGHRHSTEAYIKTDVLSQIRYRSDQAAAVVRFLIQTMGYEDHTLED